MEEEFVDLVAGPGGVISSVEDLARHAIWNTEMFRLMSPTGTLAQNDSEWWHQPRYECNGHPIRTQRRESQRLCRNLNLAIRTGMG